MPWPRLPRATDSRREVSNIPRAGIPRTGSILLATAIVVVAVSALGAYKHFTGYREIASSNIALAGWTPFVRNVFVLAASGAAALSTLVHAFTQRWKAAYFWGCLAVASLLTCQLLRFAHAGLGSGAQLFGNVVGLLLLTTLVTIFLNRWRRGG